MRFVPENQKIAILWVNVVSSSLGIDKAEAAAMFANLCGFPSWEILMSNIGSIEPSQYDEHCSVDIVQTRLAFYVDVLVSVFGMHQDFAQYLVDHASPSSKTKPKKFSISRDQLYEPGDPSSVNFREMARMAGLDSEDKMHEAMEEFAKMALGDDVPEDFSFDDFADRLRVSKPVEPSDYYNLATSLDWDTIEDTYNEEYVYGEESFWLTDDRGIDIPVYLTSLVRTPLDTSDDMANEVMSIVAEHSLQECGSNRALLFWGSPVMKQVSDCWFVHYGVYLKNGEWREFLLNESTTIEGLFKQNFEDIDCPDSIYEDKHRQLAIAFQKMLSGIEQGKPIKAAEIGTLSGWNQLMLELA